MKKLVMLVIILTISNIMIFAQVPDYLNYQAVIRDNSGELVTSQGVDIRVSIIDNTSGGTVLYTETHSETTSENGLVNIKIGNGTVNLGTFSGIDWATNNKYLQIEIDLGSGYVDMGTVQLLSVPYAFYAKNVENSDDADASPTNELQSLSLDGDSLWISEGNKIVFPYDSSRWAINGDKIYYNTGNVGIGSANPVSNLEVKANTAGSEALFQVINANNDTVFAVYPDGVKIFVDSEAKGKVGGFAVSGRNPAKAGEVDILRITIDSTRIYVNDTATTKGKVGGFAVSGRNPAKGGSNNILFVTGDSTRIYINESTGTKGKVGGFAVSGRNPAKGTTNSFLNVTPDSTRIFVKDSTAGFGITNLENNQSESLLNLTRQNYLIGHNAGSSLTTGKYNSMIGYESGKNSVSASSNLFLGHRSGYSNLSGHDNVYIGNKTGYSVEGGYNNIFIGNQAGENSTAITNNTFIGNSAGRNVNGDDNICIGDRSGTHDYTTNNEILATTIVGIDAGRNVTGDNNVVFGTGAGSSWGGASTGENNVYIGAQAGAGAYTSRLGSDNVCIGHQAGYGSTGDGKLYIANNSTTTLIYGDFTAEEVIIDGDLTATTVTPSDINLKTNLIPIRSGLQLLLSLSGYYFNWNEQAEEIFKVSSDEQQIGIIAQDVEKVFPQMVKTNSNGYKVVEYSKFSPILIEAIKEQQIHIEKVEAENKELKLRLEAIENALEELKK